MNGNTPAGLWSILSRLFQTTLEKRRELNEGKRDSNPIFWLIKAKTPISGVFWCSSVELVFLASLSGNSHLNTNKKALAHQDGHHPNLFQEFRASVSDSGLGLMKIPDRGYIFCFHIVAPMDN